MTKTHNLEDLFTHEGKRALNLMKETLGEKTRDDGESLLSEHCIRVSKILKNYTLNEKVLIAGTLHDLIEDADFDYDDLKEEFGGKVAEIVSSVSEDDRLPEKERKQEYIKRVKEAGTSAQMVKIADIIDNLQSAKQKMSPKYYRDLKKYYEGYSFDKETKKLSMYDKLEEVLS